MDKEKYKSPEMEIVEFETMSDPIVTSNMKSSETDELPVISEPKTI